MTAVVRPSLVQDSGPEDGDDPVRRRELLASAAGLTGAAVLAPPIGCAVAHSKSFPGSDELLYGQAGHPASLSSLREAIAISRRDFQTARYDKLRSDLPGLVAVAEATRQCASVDEKGIACSLLADAYIIAANFLVKLNDDPLALALADRALQAAQVGVDP